MMGWIKRMVAVGAVFVCLIGFLSLLLLAAHHPALGGLLALSFAATVGVGALALVCSALFGQESERLRSVMQARPRLCWLLGLLVLLIQIWMALSLPARPLWAILFLAFDLWSLARALPALAGWAASQVCPHPRWQPGVGGLLLALAGCTPILGWILSPQLVLLSLGASVCPRRWSPC